MRCSFIRGASNMRKTNFKIVPWLPAALLLAAPAGWASAAPVTGDTYINSAAPASNFGTAISLAVSGTHQTLLLLFDLSGLPAGLSAANIVRTSLVFYVNRVGVTGSVDVAPVLSP